MIYNKKESTKVGVKNKNTKKPNNRIRVVELFADVGVQTQGGKENV